LIGCASLRDIDREHLQAELGFWIGREWWGHGYATEAATAVIRFGFDTLGLNRICAHHMARNPAAGRVLLHVGMSREGLLRERVKKWGVYEDVAVYAILREDRN
jgi:RimJ/RimL family protein N-acetyltransferase